MGKITSFETLAPCKHSSIPLPTCATYRKQQFATWKEIASTFLAQFLRLKASTFDFLLCWVVVVVVYISPQKVPPKMWCKQKFVK